MLFPVSRETELSRLAESLVKMKLGPSNVQTIYGMGLPCHRLSVKKQSLLREMLSQGTVTRVCPTKPSRTTTGGISIGKPIVNKVYTTTVTSPLTPVSVAVSSKDASRFSAAVAVTELKQTSPTVSVVKPESTHSPLFQFGAPRSSGELDAVSKSFPTRAFSFVDAKSGPTSKEITPGTSTVVSGGIFSPAVESSKAKPNVLDSTLSRSRSQVSDVASKDNTVGDFSFSSAFHNGKPPTSESFSFAMGLSKVPSLGKLTDSSKKLEDCFEELTPPGTPDYSHGEAVPSSGSSVSSSPFTFNFTVTPTTTKSGTVSLSSTGETVSSLQKSPLVSLGSIVAGIGNTSSAPKPTAKSTVDSKSIAASSANNSSSGTTFSFGSLSLSQPQQGGVRVEKTEEPKEPPGTFKFSQAGSSFSFVVTSSSTNITDNISEVSPLKTSATTTDVTLKTPILASFGTQCPEGNSAPQANVFSGNQGQNLSPLQIVGGSIPVSGSSTNIFAQASTSLLGSLSTGSPVKQPASSASDTTPVLGKGSTDAISTVVITSKESESSPKDKSSVILTVPNENLFSQSTSVFGSLSIGSGAPSKPASSESLFGGESAPITANFVFGKQPASTESQNNSNVKNAFEGNEAADSSKTHVQKSEPPLKSMDLPTSNPDTTSGFNQTPISSGESSESSQKTEIQVVPSTSSVFGATKTEDRTVFSFAQLASSPSGPQTSVLFGQTSLPAKSLTGSIFGALETTQQTVTPIAFVTTASPTTQTTSSASTTFSFALPASTFGQKSTNLFGQPISSAAPTVSSGSFFGQSICSPATFWQRGRSVFEPPATTAARTDIFGQPTATTTTPSEFDQENTNTTQSIFDQTSSASPFGLASSSGSSYLGGFGQSGGSIFGQSGM
jgi:hypothetical protein